MTPRPEFAGHNNSELHAHPGVENPIPVDFAKNLHRGSYAWITHRGLCSCGGHSTPPGRRRSQGCLAML